MKIPDVLPTLADKALAVIRDRAGKSQPFFLYLPLTDPHTPWVPKEQYLGKSNAGLYGDFVTHVDDVLGRMMAALEDAGIAGKTLVIFTSDNGADWKPEDKAKFRHRANANWRGEKADVWDGGHRVPFLAQWPGKIAAGTVSNQLGCLTDFLSTAASITGFRLPKNAGEDSYDLLPALTETRSGPIREAVVHHSVDGVFCIRQGDWKLILGLGSGGFSTPKKEEPAPGGPQGQLYDLASDPAESDNVWLKNPRVVARLTTLLENYQKQGYSRPMRT